MTEDTKRKQKALEDLVYMGIEILVLNTLIFWIVTLFSFSAISKLIQGVSLNRTALLLHFLALIAIFLITTAEALTLLDN